MIKYKFKGWDHSELAEAFNIKIPRSRHINPGGTDDHIYIRDWIAEHITSCYQTSESIEIIKTCRVFLKQLKKNKCYEQPIWKALYKIKDDDTFIRFFLPLIGYMWN